MDYVMKCLALIFNTPKTKQKTFFCILNVSIVCVVMGYIFDIWLYPWLI